MWENSGAPQYPTVLQMCVLYFQNVKRLIYHLIASYLINILGKCFWNFFVNSDATSCSLPTNLLHLGALSTAPSSKKRGYVAHVLQKETSNSVPVSDPLRCDGVTNLTEQVFSSITITITITIAITITKTTTQCLAAGSHFPVL
jgi:hypothetical protein